VALVQDTFYFVQFIFVTTSRAGIKFKNESEFTSTIPNTNL